jgi:two-component system, OmpR family, response regulator MtrA
MTAPAVAHPAAAFPDPAIARAASAFADPAVALAAAAVADPAVERPKRRLHAVPTTTTEDPPVQAAPLTVTISIDGGGQDSRDRVLAALRELVSAVGPAADVALRAPIEAPADEPGVISLDPAPRAAFRDGRLLDLSRIEYDLLLFFAEHPRQVFTRAQLLARVWGHVHTGARTVDVHISRLRTKLSDHELITTVYGVGYRLADGAPIRVL